MQYWREFSSKIFLIHSSYYCQWYYQLGIVNSCCQWEKSSLISACRCVQSRQCSGPYYAVYNVYGSWSSDVGDKTLHVRFTVWHQNDMSWDNFPGFSVNWYMYAFTIQNLLINGNVIWSMRKCQRPVFPGFSVNWYVFTTEEKKTYSQWFAEKCQCRLVSDKMLSNEWKKLFMKFCLSQV